MKETESFSERLSKLLEVRGMSQSDLARAVDTAQSTVFAWLHGSKPRRHTVTRLAEILRVRSIWLEHGIGNPSDAPGQTDWSSVPASTSVRDSASGDVDAAASAGTRLILSRARSDVLLEWINAWLLEAQSAPADQIKGIANLSRLALEELESRTQRKVQP